MICSTTAFASCGALPPGQLSCELRAVNHRFLELSVRAPEELRGVEAAFRERVAQKVSRGKVDLNFRLRAEPGARAVLSVNDELLEQLALLARRHHPKFPEMRSISSTAATRASSRLTADLAGLRRGNDVDQTLAEFVAARERGANWWRSARAPTASSGSPPGSPVAAGIRAALRAKFQSWLI
jgi:uncharacterized protein (TIGR00255 family)